MTKLVDGDGQPVRVDTDIVMEQMRHLHTETIQTFNERLGDIQTQLQEIKFTLKRLSMQGPSDPASEVSGRALWMGVADGNESLVKSLLECGADVSFMNIDAGNETCLHLAAGRSNVRILENILRYSPRLDAYSDQGITPLMSAALADNPKAAEILVKAGCDLEAPLKDTRDSVSGRVDINNTITKGSTALFLAAQHGHQQVVELLIRNGAKVNIRTNHLFTPLHAATAGGFPAIAKLLIDQGAEIDARADDGFTPLIYAAHLGKEEVALVLLENEADIEAKKSLQMTALLEAFWMERVDTIKLLLEHGANIEGELPSFIQQASLLHWAVEINALGAVRLLLQRKPHLRSWCRGSSVDDLMTIANRNADPEIESLLRSHSS